MEAFFSAVLSSADTTLNNSSLLTARLIYPGLWSDCERVSVSSSASNKALLLRTRMLAVRILLVAATLAWIVPNFVDLLISAFTLFMMFIPLVAGLFLPTLPFGRDSRSNGKVSRS